MHAIVFTVSNSYIPALRVLISTIKRNMTVKADFIVIEEEDILSENKFFLRDVFFVKPKLNHFAQQDGRRLWKINPLNRFSIFKIKNYDKIIFLDADMICLSNIDELFTLNCDFGAVYHPYPDGYGSQTIHKYNLFDYSKAFNAGLMIINKKFLCDSVYESLIYLSKKEEWLGNQGPLNIYFNDKVTILPSNYFLTTPLIKTKDLTNIKFLHFGGSKKPWLTKDMDMKTNFSDFVLKSVADSMGPLGHMVLIKLLYKYKKELANL